MNILSDYASAFKADYGGIVSECHFTFSTKWGGVKIWAKRRSEYAKALLRE